MYVWLSYLTYTQPSPRPINVTPSLVSSPSFYAIQDGGHVNLDVTHWKFIKSYILDAFLEK